MRVAFTSSDGRTIDEHFGHARDLWLWELRPGAAAEAQKLAHT